MSKKEFWKKREYMQCPHCPKKYKVLNCFHGHLQSAHSYTVEESKAKIAEIFAKQGRELQP